MNRIANLGPRERFAATTNFHHVTQGITMTFIAWTKQLLRSEHIAT